MANNKLQKIKSSLFQRSFSVAKIGINAGLKYAANKATNGNIDNYYLNQAEFITLKKLAKRLL